MLANQGLVEPRAKAATLRAFLDAYIAGRTDVTERRLGKFRNVKDWMLEYFSDVKVDAITPGGADEFCRWLLNQFAPTTTQKECQIAAQFLRHAYRKGRIDSSTEFLLMALP